MNSHSVISSLGVTLSLFAFSGCGGAKTGIINDPECHPEDIETTSYQGPPGTEDIGLCHAYFRICNDEGRWEEHPEIVPRPESCDGEDNDCNGLTDEFGESMLIDTNSDWPTVTFGAGNYTICWQRLATDRDASQLICEQISPEGRISNNQLIASRAGSDRGYFFNLEATWTLTNRIRLSWISAEFSFSNSQANFAVLDSEANLLSPGPQIIPFTDSGIGGIFDVQVGYDSQQYLLCSIEEHSASECQTFNPDNNTLGDLYPLGYPGIMSISTPINNGAGWTICFSRSLGLWDHDVGCTLLDENGQRLTDANAVTSYVFPFNFMPEPPNLFRLGSGYGLTWAGGRNDTDHLAIYYARLNDQLESSGAIPVISEENIHIFPGVNGQGTVWTGHEIGILSMEMTYFPLRGSLSLTRITAGGEVIGQEALSDHSGDVFAISWNNDRGVYGVTWADYREGLSEPAVYFQQLCYPE